jgi:outer membrane receptor protein involved in Fe transport
VTSSTLVDHRPWFLVRHRAELPVSRRLLALACAGCAIAATAVAQEVKPLELEEVTVTGSRIIRDGMTAPSPVTVVSAERIANLGATNIGQVLNTLPSFRATSNPQTSNIQARGAGFIQADLRGLGATRTLVLVNGKRFIPSTLEGTVDLNQIPTLLIDRSEIVTGGASAAYGSDAVAGVVNLILDSDLEGVRTQLQFGQTEQSDNENYLAAIAGGSGFAGDRGHISVAFEYEDSKGTGDCYTRDWCAKEYQVITNTGTGRIATLPANNILPQAHTVNAVPGGLIVSGPLRGTAFRADGTPYQFQYGQVFPTNSTFMYGGDGYNGFIGAPLMVVPVERYVGFTHADFDITDSVKSSFELSYGRTQSNARGAQTRDTTGITIRGDNPYIPAATRTAFTNAGLPLTSSTSFTLGRMGDDFGYTDNHAQTDVYRALASLKGALGENWSWDAYYQYGGTDYDQLVGNNRIQQQTPGVPLGPGVCSPTNLAACSRIQLAADVTTNPANGQPICRSTLTNPTNGCQPANLFGLNQYSPAANQYLYGTGVFGLKLRQHVVAANVQGDLFSTWAGVVPLAAGVEYRATDVKTEADPITASSGFYVLNSTALKGDIEVTEGYLETAVPLLSGKPWAKSLELNGAVRLTDYNTSGDVTTWKYGVVYEPLDWLRLRATRSRDIRAPNTDELFRGVGSAFVTVEGQLTTQVSGGNPDLVPEAADTFTAGIAFQGFGVFEGFRASVDYYDIDIADAISTLSATTIVNRCRNQNTYCDRVTFNPNGSVAEVRTVFLNLNQLQTSGVDIELGYHLPLSGFGGAPGALDFNILATHVDHLTTIDITNLAIDRAGVTGNNVSGGGGVPNWQVNGLITYAAEPLSVSLEARFIDAGLFDATLLGPEQEGYSVSAVNSINTNHVASAVYFNLGATYKLGGPKDSDVELFVGVQNLLDRDPPVAPSNQGSTNMILFDPLGRSYRAGVRASF